MVDQFIQYIRAERRYSEGTVRAYERDVRLFMASMTGAGDDPSLISTDDVRDWIISLSDGGSLKPQSINRMVCSVRAFFKFLHRQGVIRKDPMLRIGALKSSSRLPSYITESKMENVIHLLSDVEPTDEFIEMRNELIILLFYATGIRLAELVSIDVDHFSHDMREVKVHGKGDKDRIIPIVESLREKIYAYLDKIKAENICLNGEKSLILTKKGRRITKMEVYRVVKKELMMAGVQGKTSPHVLRHTFATHLLNDGADIREIQELLGHSSLIATQIYTHNSIAKLKKVYKSAHPRAAHKKDKEDKL